MLITGLFLKMMVAKESREIGIFLSLGFNRNQIRAQYMIRVVTVLSIGILLGILLSATLGQQLISVISGSFGATSIKFIVNHFMTYIVLPSLLAIMVITTCWLSLKSSKVSSIRQRLME